METISDEQQQQQQQQQQPHFILIPWMAQGHFIPMIDIARLLSLHSVFVTVITTPGNTSRISSTISRLLPVHFTTLSFPSTATGLPPGCENLDSVPSRDLARNFYNAAKLLRQPLEHHLRTSTPPPTCIIAGVGFPWLDSIAKELNVPRLVFQGFSCFSLLCNHNLSVSKPHDTVSSPSQPFLLPHLPQQQQQQQQQQQLTITKSELPKFFDESSEFHDIYKELQEGENSADGIIVNSFDELEPDYAEFLAKATKKRVWTVGPVSLSSEAQLDISERGNKADINEEECLHWLDTQAPRSVIYVSFGSMGKLAPDQVRELGLGLAETKRPFIWVMKTSTEKSPELEEWLAGEFRERNILEGKCLLIRGWAPQVMILRHGAVGGFLTHCGWNSTLEGVAAGVPLLTWPLGADQFLNEKLVVEVLGVGVRVGAKAASMMDGSSGSEKGNNNGEVQLMVRREMVVRGVERLMDGGDEGEKRRERLRDLEKKGRRALMIGGSSWLNLELLIGYVTHHYVANLHAC